LGEVAALNTWLKKHVSTQGIASVHFFQPFNIPFIIRTNHLAMKYILPYIAILFIALSCQKDDHPCEGKYSSSYSYISTYFAPYQFKEGTYWVYQNDITAEIDSQRVVSAIDTRIGSGGGSSCGSTYAQLYKIRVRSFFTNNYFNYLIISSNFIRNPGNSDYPDGPTILSGKDIKEPADIASMTINGHAFSNVRKVFVEELDGESYNFYFVDSIGIVKWEMVDGSTVLESWSIQSWDAVL
jgi:hypothetical protein